MRTCLLLPLYPDMTREIVEFKTLKKDDYFILVDAVVGFEDGSVINQAQGDAYKDFETFLRVHVTSHPSKNKVVFLDPIEKARVNLSFALGHVEFRGGLQ